MNKVININLGGYPFTIDDDAFEKLEHYLDTIHHHFQKSEGYEEITADIETRMAELFQEKLNGRSIVTIRNVEACISIMGTPEEFGAEPLDEEISYQRKSSSKDFNFKPGKQLFADPDNQVIGGVCSGIAAYFGVEDPLWIRLLFVLGFISGTIGLWVYLILWMIVPVANTASDRLAMKGEPINVSNIGKIIESEIENFSEAMTEFGSDLGSKKKTFWQKKKGRKRP